MTIVVTICNTRLVVRGAFFLRIRQGKIAQICNEAGARNTTGTPAGLSATILLIVVFCARDYYNNRCYYRKCDHYGLHMYVFGRVKI